MFRRLRINTQERAISGDHNRLQSFAARGAAEVWRHLLLIGTSSDDLALYSEPTTLTTPLTAEIERGLMVRPAVGSLNVLVDPGVIFMIDPTAAGPDDSICVPIESVGVSLPGALAMTGNASGSTRVDVIECRRDPVPLTATDNRDIFDASTGLFTAATVTKEIQQQLEFRVRLGTPGAGYPAAVEGWLPLCVAHVPNGTTTNDTIEFWDVRPLAEDRAHGLTGAVSAEPNVSLTGYVETLTGPSCLLTGRADAQFKGRRLGGTLRRGSPGTDGDGIDLAAAINQEAGFAFGATRAHCYLYLVTPFGLPRWARYTDASSGSRLPRNPRGIPLLSYTAPVGLTGLPSSALALPASLGLGGSVTSSDAVCIASLVQGALQTPLSAQNGVRAAHLSGSTCTVGVGVAQPTAVTLASNLFSFTLTPGTHFPINAREVLVRINGAQSVAADSNESAQALLTVYKGTNTTNARRVEIDLASVNLSNATASPEVMAYRSAPVWMPLPAPGDATSFDVTILNYEGPPQIQVMGWRL